MDYREIPSFRYFMRYAVRLKPPARYLRKGFILPVAITYLVIILGLTGFSLFMKATVVLVKETKAAQQEETLTMVKVRRVKKEDFREILPTNGTVKGTSEIELKFEIAGKISSFNFREGDAVAKGEIIASMDAMDVMTRLRHAKSKRESAQSRYEASLEKLNVYRELYNMGAIIKAKLNEMELNVDSLKAEVESAKSEVVLAQSQLEKTVLVAPADGVMGIKKVEKGDFVTPNDVVGSFLEVKNVFVEMGVIEKDIEKIKKGQKVKVQVDAYPDEVFWGCIDNVSKMFRGETRTLPVKVRISNPGQKLFSGMYADCKIILAEIEHSYIVPADSLLTLGQIKVVPLVKLITEETGTVELRKVETGYEAEHYVQILDGLEQGDLVVVETQQPLKDGMKVKVIEIVKSTLND